MSDNLAADIMNADIDEDDLTAIEKSERLPKKTIEISQCERCSFKFEGCVECTES